ncbi:MAG TPA: sulfatase-like hydrolase/transferase [Thermoanaerobaculia bacterium]|nr:sulfatase-like hydrolase/transferase [Thermoanaerobaculia bacterium]
MKRSLALLLLAACTRSESPAPPPPARPSILLVTLDTTRADAIGADTPAFTALAARGMRFRYAYATVPQTLPSHASMLTGLYPAGHGVRENARHLGEQQPLVAERLHEAGYRTAAFVSAFALARRFGLGRGFDVWDEDFGEGKAERDAKATTERALVFLKQRADQPLFLWVHYYDPHYPYTPPSPYRERYARQPYLGEVASMDEQLGRLVAAFEQAGGKAILVVADHGEGLGEHGEQQHGNLLYQSTMHVPLLLVGPGVKAGTSDAPVSTRRVFHTILDWAGIDAANTLRNAKPELVMGEAMKPFLDYGWQPQVMAVDGRVKTILAGRTEVYDVVADPKETHDLGNVPRAARAALRDYPLPTAAPPDKPLDDEEQRKLASLGYVASGVKPVVRADAPRPVDMAPLYPILDRASGLFVREEYALAIPLLEEIRKKDPHNLDAALRLATAYSSLGQEAQALAAFKEAEALAPDSADVKTYLALHYARGKEWQQAEPMLERIVETDPHRVPALEALAMIRERQGRIPDAVALRHRLYVERAPSAAELVRLGTMQMAIGQTEPAIASFERVRELQGDAFRNHLELGVLYLASQRLTDARDALDRVPPRDPGYPMALFKRAQVSVLLREQDSATRIAAAREHADATTRGLIERERLFR